MVLESLGGIAPPPPVGSAHAYAQFKWLPFLQLALIFRLQVISQPVTYIWL